MPSRPSRNGRGAERLIALALLLGFPLVSVAPRLLDPDPTDGPVRSALTRRDPAGSDRGPDRSRDRTCVVRKAASALGARPQPVPDRRGPVALDRPALAAPVSPGTTGSDLTDPAYLRIFLPANPQNLRAPPVRA